MNTTYDISLWLGQFEGGHDRIQKLLEGCSYDDQLIPKNLYSQTRNAGSARDF